MVRAAGVQRAFGFSWPQVSLTSGLRPASRSLTACHRHPLSGSVSPGRSYALPPSGTGILTSCPSPTLLSLGLGPTNPTRTDLPSETLDVRRCGFSPHSRYLCQHPHSRPLQRTLPIRLHRWRDALLPKPEPKFRQSLVSVPSLSPVTFSAQSRSTSELLRTL